ncbi:cytochrome b561 and DOMON domain-containing protein At5g47530-like [Vicia villosa]|uniref:cytochrome b561 and DOMON domain-containing protein At5g47530-like n=1 Tax=Vicia villosa TaxID=3911 RepID=UPI00273C46B6|nr:cytochrome b561 and DOMON domain-containing protein At5g47530-like [Vicia villosa]
MATIQKLLLFVTLFTSFVNPTTSQPCNSYKFPNSLNYVTCKDLPKNNARDSSWIAWAINPNSKGMLGSQALIGYRKFDGTFKAYTSSITSYATMLQEGNISFPVYNLSGMYINGSMMIFASLQLPQNVSMVNHVWQEGLVADDGSFRSHALTGSNVQSFGTLDFKSGIVSQKIDGKLKSRTTLKNVHAILNAISWGTLMPIGVILARHLKSFEGLGSTWFHLHRACQSIALLIGTIGFGTGLYMGNHQGLHNTPHRCVGITLMTLALVQVFVAFCLRPKNDHKYRILWNIFHLIVGYTTVVLAIWNVFKGFDILGGGFIWRNIYGAVIGCLVFVGLVLEVVTWIRLWKKNNKRTTQELGL